NNVVIYDILSISTSNKSRILLKDLLYSKNKDEIKGNSNEQIDLFSNVEDYEDYVDLRENGVSEKEYFYSTRHYANVITQQFIGSFLPVEEFKSFLLNHEFIPTNCKTDLKKDLKDFHDVREVKDETNKRTISGYDFREARL
ncbi:MAG TPA: hypothetical protein GX525_07205, partial [Bacilli bacterium]|nr:hypothetical protein [Bacilli bacterium]